MVTFVVRPAVRRSAWFVFAAAILGIISRMWVTEDAAISFRIVENLYDGYGAVYNPGERVETFTHPLWFVLLVLLRGAGLPLHAGSIALGFFFSVCAFGVLIFRRPNRFPFAAAALALHSGVRDFSTSGLEFSVVFLLLVLLYNDLESDGLLAHPGRTATLLALLYLARPELGLLAVWYSAFFLFESTGLVKASGPGDENRATLLERLWSGLPSFAKWGVPIVLLAGGYHAIRWVYFGDIFANTYYAKSGLDTYYVQGLKYLGYTVLWSPSLWPLFLLLGLAFGSGQLRHAIPRTDWIVMVRDFGAAAVLTFYIVRVGGDFMAFRFLLPEIVIVCIVAERIIRNLSFSGAFVKYSVTSSFFSTPVHRAATLSGATAIGAAIFLWHPPSSRGWVADERNVFAGNAPLYELVLQSDYSWGARGKRYGELSHCLGRQLLITNSQALAACMRGAGLGYFGVEAGPDVRIIDEQGLPDREVARTPVLTRFRPGHEHSIDLSSVVRRAAAFCSSGEPAYDRIMQTPAGILVSLDPNLFLTLPNAEDRARRLVALKARRSPIVARLEARYKVTAEALVALASTRPALMRGREACWKAFPDQPNEYYFF